MEHLTSTEPPEPSTTPPPELEPDEFFWVFNNDGSGEQAIEVISRFTGTAPTIYWGDTATDTLVNNVPVTHIYQ